MALGGELFDRPDEDTMHLNLNGPWECGLDRNYERTVTVPGLAADPREITSGELWYRREATLPDGQWTAATLVLKGARFCPVVFVDGSEVSCQSGGMAETIHHLSSSAVKPGSKVTLEVRLQPLDRVDPCDASRIPEADRWRSNVSSCLWDDVVLVTHRGVWIDSLLPRYDASGHLLEITWRATPVVGEATFAGVEFRIQDADGRFVTENRVAASGGSGVVTLDLPAEAETWTPENPALYRLEGAVYDDAGPMAVRSQALGLRDFRVVDKRFELNGNPVRLRAGTVVWHRWLRDPEAHDLAWDLEWFEENIVRRLKRHGANTLRFHLGMPPEAILDLCDRHGLFVQAEWIFFHGMTGSRESLIEQWRRWLTASLRHPCCVLFHPWNETEGEQLRTAFDAIETLSHEFPPLVVSHRDVLHVHKYWWSMFENVGVYYDSADQFSQPIMVDEFGGNYLDGQCEPGGYPALRGSFLRFLGPDHTPELRVWLQTEANCRIAEYWRCIGTAGFSPFCALGSPEDGNHHFLGPLSAGRGKPVWDALTAAWAPISVSLDLWDRNFLPGQSVELPLHLLNDTAGEETLQAEISVIDGQRKVISRTDVAGKVPAFGHEVVHAKIETPSAEGWYRIEAELQTPQPGVEKPVVSHWDIITLQPQLPEVLRGGKVGTCQDEAELRAFLKSFGVSVCAPDDVQADVIVVSRPSWEKLSAGQCSGAGLVSAIGRGTSVVMLDVGPRELGQGYLEGGDLGPLQGSMWIAEPGTVEQELFKGISLQFREQPEPESHIHPTDRGEDLWQGMDLAATWLWNGLRGGLIVPARDLDVVGLSAEMMLNQWQQRGADPQAIQEQDDYHAFELAGQYAFSTGRDEQTQHELRRRVKFLVEDAPALAGSIDPNGEIQVCNLSQLHRQSQGGEATSLQPLVCCGKGLVRTPVVAVEFGPGEGKLIVSQLITAGRLAEGFGTEGFYGLRRDPAAQQFTLNLVAMGGR